MHHYAKPFLFVSLFDCISVESRSFTTVGFVSSGWFGCASYDGFTPMLLRWWRINFEKLNNRHEKWEKLFDEYVKLVWVSGCIEMQLVVSAKPNIENLFFSLLLSLDSSLSYSHGQKKKDGQFDNESRSFAVSVISSVSKSLKIQFVVFFYYYVNWAKTKIKPRGSFFCLCFCWFRGASFPCGLLSMLNGTHVTGSWKCIANRNSFSIKKKENTKQPLHQMIVKQHTKLPMENFLYDDGLFAFFRATRTCTFYVYMILCQSPLQLVYLHIIANAWKKKLYFYLHFMSCFKL